MSIGIKALTYLPPTSIVQDAGDLATIKSIRASLYTVAKMQEEELVAGTYLAVRVYADDPFNFAEYDYDVEQTAEVKAFGTITCLVVVDTNTVTVNGLLYTAVSVTPTSEQFIRDGDDDVTAGNLRDVINNDTRAGSETLTATAATNVVTVTTNAAGTLGNAVTLVSSGSTLAVTGGGFLTGGVNPIAFNLSLDDEVVATIVDPIGRPALASRRQINIAFISSPFLFTVRSALAVISMVEGFEDLVAESGDDNIADDTYTDRKAPGSTNPFETYLWTVTKDDAIYTLTPTVDS